MSAEAILEAYSELAQTPTRLSRSFAQCISTDDVVTSALADDPNTVFEGSQGALLDEWCGCQPNTIWSTVTPDNARVLLTEAEVKDHLTIGVTRSYMSRHGFGPFPSEFPMVDRSLYPEPHNAYGRWQGDWRLGALDLPLLRYSALHSSIDEVAVTHLDLPQTAVVDSYPSQAEELLKTISVSRTDKDAQGEGAKRLALYAPTRRDVTLDQRGREDLIEAIEQVVAAPVTLTSYGPTHMDKIARSSSFH